MRTAPDVIFPGVRPPSTDMQAVRDGRRAIPFLYPVSLAAARSIVNGMTLDPSDASGKALRIPVGGNVFYSDPLFDLTGASVAGIARVHFQDTANLQSPFLTVLPTALFRIPFTELLIENYAQAGKFLQIVYGTDIDINPGVSSQVQATILNSMLSVDDLGFSYGAAFASSANLAANTPENVIAAASNVNGYTVWDAEFWWQNGTGISLGVFLAKATAPANRTDGDVLLSTNAIQAQAAIFQGYGKVVRSVNVSAGKRLDGLDVVVEGSGHRKVLYTLK